MSLAALAGARPRLTAAAAAAAERRLGFHPVPPPAPAAAAAAAASAAPARAGGASAGLVALLAGGGASSAARRRGRRCRGLASGCPQAPPPLYGAAEAGPTAARGSRTAASAATGSARLTAEPVPVVLLSGFLGTGKTTLLKHWLENAEGRIGVVVNDVAAVNIDAKLVDSQQVGASGSADFIQMSNGCACCSLGDELLVSIYDLLQLSTEDRPFSQIVVELSGIAEPQRVKENFVQAAEMGSEVVEGLRLEKVVTLVDTSTFCTDYMEYKKLLERPDLVEDDGGASFEVMEAKVVELLCEQVESADVVVLNKTDLASEEQRSATAAVVTALNGKAAIRETSFGKVAFSELLAAAPAEPALDAVPGPQDGHGHGESHSHGESHGHSHAGASDCQDGHGHGESHSHGESHGHSHAGASDCQDADCGDASHGHGHECSDPGCTDESHGHAHSHSHGGHECSDPGCTDESHGHAHSHSHGGPTTAAERFGITSFVYAARRPFNADRLAEALSKWPVPNKDDLGEILSSAPAEPDTAEALSPLSGVIRSKGYCWIDTHPSSRMFWSHAGKNMALQYEGVWWGAMPEDHLESLRRQSSAGDYERARREEWDDEWADRRQEIVFIGQRLDEPGVRAVLDGCLLTDDEIAGYREAQARDEEALAESGAMMY